MKNNSFSHLLLLVAFCFCRLIVSAQIEEIALTNNPFLLPNTETKRSGEQQINIYLPINGTVSFCATPELIDDFVDTYTYSMCYGELQGVLEIQDSCVTFTHAGIKSNDRICLEICDTLGNCTEFEVIFSSVDRVSLPFVDDFSTSGPYPDTSLWLDRDVFVNNRLAERPLTIGFATFDGLNANGSPYDSGPGFSDNLTSAFIDLSEESEVYFSFYAQPKGVGIKPRTMDSLVVDFKHPDGSWVRMWQLEGLPNNFPIRDPAPDFSFERWIIPDTFYHDAFQFRFRNKSKNEGLQELWHVDYVRVGENEVTSAAFRDIAFRYPPTSILSPYSSMPADQFAKEEVRRNILSTVNNLDQVDVTMNDPTITISLDGTNLLRRTFIEPVEFWKLSPGVKEFDFDMNDGGSTNYQALQNGLFDALQPGQNYEVLSELAFTRTDEVLGAAKNNRVTAITTFADYYSYDDGTAESAILDQGSTGVRPTKLAMEFHNNEDDVLQGVQFHIPHIEGNSSGQLFYLYIWVDSLSEEPRHQQIAKVYYADNYFDTLQGFTTYDLRDTADQKISIPIPKGKFYIGWEQIDISGQKIPFGYDINSPVGISFLHFNVGQGWAGGASSGLRAGSLMVRPVMGDEEIISTDVINYEPWQDVRIYPNPTNGLLTVETGTVDLQGDIELEVFNLLGQRLLISKLEKFLDLSGLESGSYLVKINDHSLKRTTIRKIFLTK